MFGIYAKKIKYVDWRNILKLVGGLIVTREICIDGLNSGKVIENIVNQACKAKGITNIRDINKNLLIPSIDLNTGAVYFFSSINENRGYSDKIRYINNIEIGKAVRASCSFPAVFCPCEFEKHSFLDGGVLDNVPVEEVKKQGADIVIAVNFKADEIDEQSNIMDVVMKTIDIMGNKIGENNLQKSDDGLTIETDKTGLLDIKKLDNCYKYGYEAVSEKIEEIKQVLSI